MAKPEMEFWDPFASGESAWEPIEGVPGLAEYVLSKDPQTGSVTRLLRFDPGCDSTPMGVQRHDFWEEVLIYQGALHDLTLNKTFRAGEYACRPPGMAHGPWTTPEGCITFEVRTYE
ncbi:cupin domain-containing protein [Amycolatopsis taiwanensis]|uniref:ChrR-like cupin domain-containing protein n=1 Tax=Amycolatopsis taiwanensis TaxID=342230 RepID=A0A9W6VGV4_9PSEU|nr:cupin domain-containing protein [Amycolatopsis taiwanensis]GLY68135.1 hypothetical protein Atai01_47540 [Amycolatopsis taiwanensis]